MKGRRVEAARRAGIFLPSAGKKSPRPVVSLAKTTRCARVTRRSTMKTKQLIAGISAATVLAMVTPAYAGLLGGGGGAAGALGGSLTSGIGGMSGQGAFDGRGAAGTSFDGFPARQASRATKPAASGAESAQRSGSMAKAVGGSAAHEVDGSGATALGQASGRSSSTANAAGQLSPRAASTAASTAGSAAGSASSPAATAPAPATKVPSPTAATPSAPSSVMTGATGAGGIDAQHSRGDNSVAVSGEASGSASRTE